MTYSKNNQIRKYVQHLKELKTQHLNLIKVNMAIFKKKTRN